ncbi:VOC family protein [uncultured Alsobacter sp.]|uniref:VOC family protein n=1 Tax=uncultured Alsobacter sp. TaxID=1748258 RepID=UPI0025EA59E2|nr:VOC family protein [uncultured Alsobacter sp.]
MTETQRSRISHCLWFGRDAEEAARFYTALLPGSRIDKVTRSPGDYPGGKAGDVLVVEFTVAGQHYIGLNGGTDVPSSNKVSLFLTCDDQAEVDRVWDAFVEAGGKPVACGWLNDRWGHTWQVVPKGCMDLLSSPDAAANARAYAAMMTMVKLDYPKMKAAFDGAA